MATLARFRDRAAVYHIAQGQSNLWCVMSGLLRLSTTMNQDEPKQVHVVGPGIWFGELFCCMNRPGWMETRVRGATELLLIRLAAFVGIAKRHPETWLAVQQLASLNQMLSILAGEDLMFRNPMKRLAAVLSRLSSNCSATQAGAPIEVIPETQSEIAVASNLSTTVLTGLLKKLGAPGAVKSDYGKIRVLSPALLKRQLGE